MPANLENSAVATGQEKVSFRPIPKKGNATECSNYCTIALISSVHGIFQARVLEWVAISFSRKGNAKECSNYQTIAFISHAEAAAAHASKVMLKILQARLQQYINHELPEVQAGF